MNRKSGDPTTTPNPFIERYSMKRRTVLLSTILLLAGSQFLFSEIRDSKTLHRQAPLPEGKTVVVDNRNGNVEVLGWSKDSIDVTAEVEVRSRRHSDQERTLESVRIKIEPKGDRLMVEADSPEAEGGSGFWDWIFGKHIQVSIDFHIRVPDKSDLNLETANGNVRVKEVQGRLRLESTNGNVEAEGASGTVEAETTNGNAEVRCGILKAVDRITCRTTNGDVSAVLSEKTEADVEMSTVNGKVNCGFPITVQGGISSNRIHGRIGQGGGTIHLSTVNGNARLSKE
jgi:DUF4097 and DUF4098 domain-containing protein YvlB